MRDLRLVLSQTALWSRITLRTPQGWIFTLAFPAVLLVLFNSIFAGSGSDPVEVHGVSVPPETYQTAGLIAYAASLSTFTSLVINMTTQRESGQLKRLAGSPVPGWTFIAAMVLRAVIMVLIAVVLLLGIGVGAFGVAVPGSSLIGFAIILLLGTSTMCLLGIGVSGFAKTTESASAVGPFAVVILSFISGVFVPMDVLPSWLQEVGRAFPLAHIAEGLQVALAPDAPGIGLRAADLIALALWGAVGALLAVRKFRWEPLDRG